MAAPEHLRLFLCGDVMTGRGIDQLLPHPAGPELYERCIADARDYIHLAEESAGPIPRPVGWEYIWGDALPEMRSPAVHARIVNLETAITCSSTPWPHKGIHYRMHPNNAPCLTAAGIDCCCLANNHVLDWGYAGLEQTLATLDAHRLPHAGAGRTLAAAIAPARLATPAGRVLVFAAGLEDSGIPPEWSATADRPGVWRLPDLSAETLAAVVATIRPHQTPGDVTVVSIHWGGNWGYLIPAEQTRFAHGLIDAGVDVIHGHSSHHVKAVEIYCGRLILYGCGDFVTDYEGITGHEDYRSDLALMYLIDLAPAGQLLQARLLPMQSRRLRLTRAPEPDGRWLCDLLTRQGAARGTTARWQGDGCISLTWRTSGVAP